MEQTRRRKRIRHEREVEQIEEYCFDRGGIVLRNVIDKLLSYILIIQDTLNHTKDVFTLELK